VLQCRPHTSDFLEEYHNLENQAFRVVLSVIPGQRHTNGPVPLGIRSATHRQWLAHSMGQGILRVETQPEAHELLMGRPVDHQSLRELSITTNGLPGPPVDTPAVAMPTTPNLDKPRLHHVDEYRVVSAPSMISGSANFAAPLAARDCAGGKYCIFKPCDVLMYRPWHLRSFRRATPRMSLSTLPIYKRQA
jgi:hypothetical protein